MNNELREPVFWVLTALAGRRAHGYALMAEAARLSGGQMELRPATLYATLDRLERQGLIAKDGDEVLEGRLRRYFRITKAGTARLVADRARLAQMTRAADRAISAHPVTP